MDLFFVYKESIRKTVIAALRYYFYFSTYYCNFRFSLIGKAVEICRFRKCRWPFGHLHSTIISLNEI